MAASFNDLDGLCLTTIAEHLPVDSIAALAATCRNCHSVLGDAENEPFWKKVASEVWGVAAADNDAAATPRLPGGAGAGEPAGSWKETCVAHSRLLSRYGREAGTRAARAWHRIEAALETVARAPEVLATLAPGVALPGRGGGGGGGSSSRPRQPPHLVVAGEIHNEVLAAAAIHNGQRNFFDTEEARRGGPSIEATRVAQLGLLGTAVIYGEGHARWLRNLIPDPTNAGTLDACFSVGRGQDRGPRLLHEIVAGRPALDPSRECHDIEGSQGLALELETAKVFVRSRSRFSARSPLDPPEFPDLVKRADGGRGLLSFLEQVASALETRQLGPERDSFFRKGAMEVSNLLWRQQQQPPPATRCLSRFASAPPGLASRETAGALVVSRAMIPTWLSQIANAGDPGGVPRPATQEMHVFSYRVRFKLLSIAEQKRRQRGQQQQRVIRSATLISRHWETRPESRGAQVEMVDGDGVVGLTPTLVANENDDDKGDEGEDDDEDDDASSFCYCSRISAPPHPTDAAGHAERELPLSAGRRLGSLGGHFVFRVVYEGGATARVEAAVEDFEMRVPAVAF